MILAHKDNNGNVQSLQDHSFNVATKAREDANVIDQGDILFLLGLYHDLGKANQEFQDKLLLHPNKHVDHSSAGARYLLQKIQICLKSLNVEKKDREFFQEICAYVISSHHGMYDILLQDETINASQYTYNRLRYRIMEGTEPSHYQEDIVPFAQKLESRLPYYGYSSLDDLIKKSFENYQKAWSNLKQKKSRFFYITPFLSVLEQNASEIKKITGDAGVLEHHSNVIHQNDDNDDKNTLMLDYLIDSWDSQIILTSMVQFFQTLFKTKSSNIRRFSNLANSVLILDEVQSLPIEVTTLFNLTMNFLNKVMNTSIILCTATQPAYDSTAITHRLDYGGKNNECPDIVELSHDEMEVFARTELRKFKEENQNTRLSELVDFVLENSESILAIFNTKKTVDKFYMMLEGLTDRPLYQLSTNMCAQHRFDMISEIKQHLKNGVPIICISTQLIEAGVDVDFNQVIRSYAGIDSIVQASGRCNREGKRQKGQVTLVNLMNEEEDISRLKEVKNKKKATEDILDKNFSPIDTSRLNSEFFESYYTNNKSSMDYSLSSPEESVFDYLSKNKFQLRPNFIGRMKQAFKTAGKKMNLINNETIGVLVPYGAGIEKLSRLEELCESNYPSEGEYQIIKSLLKELQSYTVNVREHDPILEATKSYLNGNVLVLSDGYYHEKKGITIEMLNFIM